MTPHSHDPQEQSVAVAKLRASLKERAAGSRGTLTQVRKDQAQVATALLRDQHGEPPVKRTRRHTVQLQTKLHNLCTARRDGTKSIPNTLRGIGHFVRWK